MNCSVTMVTSTRNPIGENLTCGIPGYLSVSTTEKRPIVTNRWYVLDYSTSTCIEDNGTSVSTKPGTTVELNIRDNCFSMVTELIKIYQFKTHAMALRHAEFLGTLG